MAAHQAPLSLGFSRQEQWSGLPFPSPMQESEKWKQSHSVVSDSSWPHGPQPTRFLHPWDSPGKSTGVECHCLLLLMWWNLHKNLSWACVIFSVLSHSKDLKWDHCYSSLIPQFYLANKGWYTLEAWGQADPKGEAQSWLLFLYILSPPPEPALCKLG